MHAVHEASEVTGESECFMDEKQIRKLQKLPVCANDNDCIFLLKHMCDDGPVPSGPYLIESDAKPPAPSIARVTERLSSAFIDDNMRAYL